MTQSEAIAIVRAKYPRAVCSKDYGRYSVKFCKNGAFLIWRAKTRADAWIEAAERIKAREEEQRCN